MQVSARTTMRVEGASLRDELIKYSEMLDGGGRWWRVVHPSLLLYTCAEVSSMC